MNVTIRNIDKIIFSHPATEITLPGMYGSVGIRSHHAPMSVVLSAGDILVRHGNKSEIFKITQGIAQINNSEVDVFVGF